MKLYRANILNPINPNNIQFIDDGGIIIDVNGLIIDYGNFIDLYKKFPNSKIIDFNNKLITPGFIDGHCHLPQYKAIGLGNGTLFEWLNDTIFPLEAKFNDYNYAYKASKMFFQDVLSKGTTTIFIYSTIHYTATEAAFKAAGEAGIRAYIGNALADAPSHFGLSLSISQNIDNCEKLLNKYHKSAGGKLEFVITPRYAGNCSLELMKKGAEFALANDLFIQTHLAENIEEIELIKNLFSNIESYTEVYNQTGLLNNKSILGHCIYLNDEEQNIINDKGGIICHCPTSNRFLKSGIMPLTKYIDMNQKICFGTDVGAGYSLSILHEAMEAIENSKYKALFSKDILRSLTLKEAFYYITLGAAESLGLNNRIGSFSQGKYADFIVFDKTNDSIVENSNLSNVDQLIADLLYKFDDNKITEVYVKGLSVYNTLSNFDKS